MTLHSARPAVIGSCRPMQLLFFSGDAAAPTGSGGINGKDNSNHTTKESLARMLRDEFEMSAKDSKRAVDAVFDKIVEVRLCLCVGSGWHCVRSAVHGNMVASLVCTTIR